MNHYQTGNVALENSTELFVSAHCLSLAYLFSIARRRFYYQHMLDEYLFLIPRWQLKVPSIYQVNSGSIPRNLRKSVEPGLKNLLLKI